MTSTTFRHGTYEDLVAVFTVFRLSLADLLRRHSNAVEEDMATPEGIDAAWPRYQTLFEALMEIDTRFTVAELEGRIIGYARSIALDGIRELTDFFVLPGGQSSGVGKQLLMHAFPGDQPHRSIIATTDIRAQIRYLKSDLYPQTVNYTFLKIAEPCPLDETITFRDTHLDDLARLARIDRAVLGFEREAIHRWLIGDRPGCLMLRDNKVIGYCYGGERVGPCATLHPADIPTALSFIENEAARDEREIAFVVPGLNHAALDHLLARSFRADGFLSVLMMNKPLGKLDRYVITTPEFVV